MSNPTQLYHTDTFGSTFVDPAKPTFSVRFKTTKNRKAIAGESVDNYVTEIIINDNNSVELCSSECGSEAVSVRLKVSGSNLSQPRLKAIVESMSAQVANWIDENVLLGFQPTTVPVNPA